MAALILGGGVFAFKAYKQSRPSPIWVPLTLNPDLPPDKQDEMAKQLKTKLLERVYLLKASKDLNLKTEWNLESDDKGADELAKRMFVKVGTYDSPEGNVPSINIGVSGMVKERDLSGKIATHLARYVFEFIKRKTPLESQ